MSEHDHGIQCLAFSDDELLLCTVGVVDDNKILIWDLSNGFIVTMVSHNPTPCTCVTWGGMIKDIKRRDTANYQLCTSGNQRIVLWNLDPRTGEMVGERVITEGRGTMVRDFTGLAFSDDKETIYCATTSGDFALVNVKRQVGHDNTEITPLGDHLLTLLPLTPAMAHQPANCQPRQPGQAPAQHGGSCLPPWHPLTALLARGSRGGRRGRHRNYL
mmetsp:Transcript_46034/g.127954  ORF Transcript_46034/g.127954 Transcript_46034/m.127954 type:complete len:216 (-) Transcript_46034:1713-2360(-)